MYLFSRFLSHQPTVITLHSSPHPTRYTLSPSEYPTSTMTTAKLYKTITLALALIASASALVGVAEAAPVSNAAAPEAQDPVFDYGQYQSPPFWPGSGKAQSLLREKAKRIEAAMSIYAAWHTQHASYTG